MTRITIDRPNPKQERCMRSKKRYVIFGGARGGGKSWTVRTKSTLLCLHYAGIKVLIVRRTYPELVANHIDPLKTLLRGVARYNGVDKKFLFVNGSAIKLGYCAKDDDLRQYQGQEYDVIFVDEATQLTEWQIKQIAVCVRGANAYPKRLYLTCNPGGKGHQYVRRLVERRFRPEEDPDDYEFIQSLVTDNAALMAAQPDYVKMLDALPARLRDAWRYGRWDVFEGQFFEEFRDDPAHYADRRWTHVIPAMETLPRGWRVYRSYDWGYNHPFSCAWWAVDYDGVIYRILELYGCKRDEENVGVHWTDEKQFAEIARIEREHPYLAGREIKGVADPSIWGTEKTGVSTYDVAAKHRVFFEKANNDRIRGWMQCRYRLAFDEQGYPMMYVFDTCKAFLRTIPTLSYSDTRPEDLDSDQEDHVADEWRYFCMSRPIPPRESHEERAPMADPLNQFARKN